MGPLEELQKLISSHHAGLVAVSKTKPVEDIQRIYDLGIKDFGENRVQELREKHPLLPKDIRWHLIGHLQVNKVKYIAPFVYLIHSVDSAKLMHKIQSEATKNNKTIAVLLQVKIATEETKYGLLPADAEDILDQYSHGVYPNIDIRGFMGMASFVSDHVQVRNEFRTLRLFRDRMNNKYVTNGLKFPELSMGMSGDYAIALEEGSTMVRIGTLIFGSR